jgi:hypothetical protein
MRAVRLQYLDKNCSDKWILRVGEFYVVLCALRALGSVENSGIDDAWVESGLYGSTTARQILEGKHMKRALVAHVTTLQVLFDLLMQESDPSTIPNDLVRAIDVVAEACSSHRF